MLGIDGTCACVAASLKSCLYLNARTRSSCLSPKPETLNPETVSGTSGARAGPQCPLYNPPTTRECETEQTCELCGQTPPANSKAIPVRIEISQAKEV